MDDHLRTALRDNIENFTDLQLQIKAFEADRSNETDGSKTMTDDLNARIQELEDERNMMTITSEGCEELTKAYIDTEVTNMKDLDRVRALKKALTSKIARSPSEGGGPNQKAINDAIFQLKGALQGENDLRHNDADRASGKRLKELQRLLDVAMKRYKTEMEAANETLLSNAVARAKRMFERHSIAVDDQIRDELKSARRDLAIHNRQHH